MKFGEAVKLIFQGHYDDLASTLHKDDVKNTRYTHESLKAAIERVPWVWRKFCLEEFSILTGVLRRSILECPHEKTKVPYDGRIECLQCGCHRCLELEDKDPHSYNERKVWSKWECF